MDNHLRRSLQSTRPSVSQKERNRLSRMYALVLLENYLENSAIYRYREFISERGGGLPVPTESTAVGSRVSLM